jgi:hypothetical protein
MQQNYYIHPVGITPNIPETQNANIKLEKEYLPKFPVTDKDWVDDDKQMSNLDCHRAIGSVPIKIDPPKPNKFPLGMAFVLNHTNHLNIDLGEIEDGIEAVYESSDKKAQDTLIKVSYNVTLRALEVLAKKGHVWFGVKPCIRPSDAWRYFKGLPEEEAHDPNAYAGINPNQTNTVMEGKIVIHESRQQFSHRVFQCETLKVIISPEGSEELSWVLPKEEPFIVPLLDADDIYCNTWSAFDLICNDSFIDLCKTDPKKAQQLYEDSLGDGFHYQSASSDQSYCDWHEFLGNYSESIVERFCENVARQKQLEQMNRSIRKMVKELIAIEIPETYPSITQGRMQKNNVKLHIKNFAITASGIHVKATVEYPDKVYHVDVTPNETWWKKTERTRSKKKPKP